MPKVTLITALLANNIFFSNIAVAETDKPKFYASSAEARNLAKDMGIDSYVTYPEQGDMAVFTITLNVDEGVSVPRDKVVATHQIIADQYKQLGEMGIFPRKPDTVHLHIDFIDGNDNGFQLLSKKLAEKARASGLLLESLGLEFLDDKYIHRYSPHVLPKSYQIHLKINPDCQRLWNNSCWTQRKCTLKLNWIKWIAVYIFTPIMLRFQKATATL